MENVNDRVDAFEEDIRELETRLEALGRSIRDMPKSGPAWQHVNRAMDELQRAYYAAIEMRNG